MKTATFKIWRGDAKGGEFRDYRTEISEGMVVLDHQMHEQFIGPRFLIHVAALEMHPLDTEDRIDELRNAQGIGYCNITKCCTKVCPENIEITDNGIIPLKERVVDDFYDPFGWFWRWLKRRKDRQRLKPV